MHKTLVVYYSRTGTAERLARQLAISLDADLDAVHPDSSYRGRSGYLKAIWHSLRRYAPTVAVQLQPSHYDLVVIVTPVWAGRLSAPMRGYLRRFKDDLGRFVAVWVSGSGLGYAAVGEEIESLAGHAPSVTAWFSQTEIRPNGAQAKLDPLIRSIRSEQALSAIRSEICGALHPRPTGL